MNRFYGDSCVPSPVGGDHPTGSWNGEYYKYSVGIPIICGGCEAKAIKDVICDVCKYQN